MPRELVCNLGALNSMQRDRHLAMTLRLLETARHEETAGGHRFTLDRAEIAPPDLAEWVADEARCCPGVDFRLDLPADGPLQLEVGGGEEVRSFLAAVLGL